MDNLYEDLIAKYPNLFPIGKIPCSTSIDCDIGWYRIISLLCENINSHVSYVRKERMWALLKNRALERARRHNDPTILVRYFTKRFPTLSNQWVLEKSANEFNCGAIQKLAPVCKKVAILQVKEKFGTLRFYTQGGDSTVYGMIRMAESMSAVICEYCGNPGKAGGSRWVKTLCPCCHATREAELNGNK